jgi:histidine phosphotransferase ChpT
MDQTMKEAALDLIRSGGQKSVALLKFARIAYGAAGGRGAELPMEEAELILRDLYRWAKAELVWRVPAGLQLKEKVKTLLILAHAASDCVPRGGTVTVFAEAGGYGVTAEGPRALLNDDLVAALNGVATDLKPKFAPAYIAGVMARELGGGIIASRTDDKIVMQARFQDTAPIAMAR